MGQRALIGRQRSMITLDHFSPFAPLFLQLERLLEGVDVEACRRIEADHYASRFAEYPARHTTPHLSASRFEAIEAAVAHQAAHNGTILLLDKRLIVLLVGTRTCHLEFLLAAPWHADG